MQLDELTNDAQYLLSQMYKKYIEERSNGQNKKRSRYFGSEFEVGKALMPEWPHIDVKDTLNELSRKELLDISFASGTATEVNLTTDAVALMEHKFKDKVDSVLEYATKIKSLIPFI